MSRCLLKSGEVDAIGRPADQPWLLIEASVIERGVPPDAETTASRELEWKNNLFPIADENTSCFPSGDQRGPLSGPGCDTIFFTSSRARSRT